MPICMFYIVILNGFLFGSGSNDEHVCIHDEVCNYLLGCNEMGAWLSMHYGSLVLLLLVDS